MRTVLGVVFAGLLLLPCVVWADVEAPVKFLAEDLTDLGDFHGEKANANPAEGWGFWGAREPIVTSDWVVFPVKGKYRFIIDAKSHQFDKANDTKNGVYAEVDLKGRFFDLNGVKKIAKVKADQQEGELLILHTRIKADADKGEWFTEILEAGSVDPENKLVIEDDQETGIIEFDAGMKAQLAVWFTNDQWDPAQVPAWDRNLRLRSFEILLPEGVNLAVDPTDKLATTWGNMKRYR